MCVCLTKALSPIWKKLIFGSVVKVRVSLQEINVSLCNVPKRDLGRHVCVCVCVCARVCESPARPWGYRQLGDGADGITYDM